MMINDNINEINLENPIFAYYLDSRGLTRQMSEDRIYQIKKVFPTNVTLWIVPSEQPSKIECIYDGKLKINKLKELHEMINLICSELNNSDDFSDFKNKIRDILINNILDGQ